MKVDVGYHRAGVPCSDQDQILTIAKVLLEKGADTTIIDDSRQTALHTACRNGSLKVITEILRHDTSSIDFKDDNQETPLFLAAYNDYIEVVDELLKHNPDINAPNFEGMTALHFATKEGNLEIVTKLFTESPH